MARVFISYSRADRQFVDELVPLLRKMYGNDSLWFDDDIHGGDDWWQMILSEIAACDLFIYLSSNDSLGSPYCQAEMREALRLHKAILPVLVRPKTNYPGIVANDLNEILKKTQYVDLSRGFKDHRAMTDLYSAVNHLLTAVPSRPPTPLNALPISQPVVLDKSKRRPKAIWTAVAVISVLIVTGVVIGIIALSGGDKDKDQTGDNGRTQVALEPSSTFITALPITPTDQSTPTPTLTATATWTLSPTEEEATIQALMSIGITENAQTSQASEWLTQEAITAVGQLTAEALTATATLSTATPTQDFRATADARLTETQTVLIAQATQNAQASETQAVLDLTATAILWTDTPTPTPTLTPSPTPDSLENADGLVVDPQNSETGVLLDQKITITFNQEMDHASVEDAFSLMTLSSNLPGAPAPEEIEGEFNWSDDGWMVTFTPTNLLPIDMGFEYILDAETALNATGMGLSEDLHTTFHTVPYPNIERTLPENGAQNVGPNDFFTIYFTSPMDVYSLEDKVIIDPEPSLDYDTYYYEFSYSYSLNFEAELNTNYTITILPGMLDIYGNPIEEGMVVNYKTTPSLSTETENLELAEHFSGTNNTDWVPFIQEFDGVEMVLVPVGCFMMGSETSPYSNERPAHRVCFENPFWLDRTEVTNGQFTQFNGDAEYMSGFSGDDHPREQISWFEAAAYCESRGARLPTEAEWEYAARGVEGWEYPWGNEWDQSRVIGFRDSGQGTAEVMGLLDGASWVGALDLSGSIWEWVADWYGEYHYGALADRTSTPSGTYRVLRGGSWLDHSPDYFRAPFRSWDAPQYWSYGVGFRCARSR